MAKTKRNKSQREKDLEEIARRYLQGETQAAIAADLVVTQQQVSYDLRILQKRWQKSALVNIDESKAKELAKVDHLEREYWAAWERSCQETERTTNENSARDKAQIRRQQPSGDPRFLAGVQWCINKRCEIMGLDAPTKQETRMEVEHRLKAYAVLEASPDVWDKRKEQSD